MMSQEAIIESLRNRQLLSRGEVRVTPLGGGVSSEIYMLADGMRQLVVKRALPKLKVRDEWRADTSRSQVEQQFIQYIRAHIPQNVLPVVLGEPSDSFFVMEFLGEGFVNWKEELLAEKFDTGTASAAARLLATIHWASWDDAGAREQFRTDDNFYALRVHPYLITTGERNPRLRDYFTRESDRLLSTHQALVHGDFSPKNIMVEGKRLVLLDHEVAWFGDPAFDLAFLLNHLFLKSLLFRSRGAACVHLAQAVWEQYFKTLGAGRQTALGPRACRLLLMLMLARIDGKSPVEYLAGRKSEQGFVRSFVEDLLPSGVEDFTLIRTQWLARLTAPWK
jgi:aminoglycoside phosphotransferase (APT) family kinase protein